MAKTDVDLSARAVSRRGFLRLCAVASGGLAPAMVLRPQAIAQAQQPSQKADTAGAAPKKGGTLRVGFYIEAATMDPHFSGSKVDRQIYHNIYEPLVVLDAKLGIKPGLAESWQQPDPKTLVFKLRRGVKFHDGTDFNAEAARFNFTRMKTEPKSVRKGELANVDSVDVVDAYTIKLNLKKPDAALMATLTDRAGMMISPKVAQERGPELERNAKGAGTGPFVFAEWIKDDHLLLKRNENYWNKQGGPYLDQIRYRPIPDDVVKLQSLQSGEIDVMDYVQPRDVAAVKADRNVVVLDVPSLASFAYQLNHTRPPFNNKALRQALAHAVDTEQIVKGVWLNVGVPSNGPIPPTSWAYDSTIKPIRRDLAKAKAKLAEGGQPNGFSLHGDDGQHPDQLPGGRGHPGPARRGRHHHEDQAGRCVHPARGGQQQELRDDQLPVERSARPGRQHLPVLQDVARHVAELVGHLQPPDRRAARQEPRAAEPGRAEEGLQRADEDLAGRAAHAVHRASHRAEGLQPAGPELPADPGRDDALQGRVAEVGERPPRSAER